ncbi:hypothetical protein [Methylobacterium sp. SI9]|uniref:hypothetical protein n=1 Tax=Methylobacterium guangdongense TaxID=3138811 RepID=UPI00313A8F84
MGDGNGRFGLHTLRATRMPHPGRASPFLAVDGAGHRVACAAPPVVAQALDAWLNPA